MIKIMGFQPTIKMNLNDFMNEGAWKNPYFKKKKDVDTFIPGDKPTDIKRELYEQWYGPSSFDFDYDDNVIESKEKEEDLIAVAAVSELRKLMALGFVGSNLKRAINNKFASDVQSEDWFKKIVAQEEGILGTLVIDASLFGGCRKTAKVLTRHPFKNQIKFIANCNCGAHRTIIERSGNIMESNEGDAISSFLNNDYSPQQTTYTEICPITHKQYLAGYADLDEDEMAENYIDPMIIGQLDKEEKELVANQKSTIAKIATMYKLFSREKKAQFPLKVDNYIVGKGDGEIQIDEAVDIVPEMVMGMGAVPADIDFDLTPEVEDIDVPLNNVPNKPLPIEIVDVGAVDVGMEDVDRPLIQDVPIDAMATPGIEIEEMEQELHPGSLTTFNKPEHGPSNLDIIMEQEAHGGDFDIEMSPPPDLDIMPDYYVEPEFEGFDTEMLLNKKPKGDFDITF